MRLAGLFSLAILASGLAISADGPTFEVASVKLAVGAGQPPYGQIGGPGTNDPGRFHVSRTTMFGLLIKAFDVSTDQIAGPAWLKDIQHYSYTVDAVIPPNTTKDQFQQMLQNLLAERFHLIFHRQTRNFPGYDLVVDKGGPKFKEITPTPDAGARPLDVRTAPKGADGFPAIPGSQTFPGGDFRTGQSRTKYQERTMAQFVSNLGFAIGSSQGKGVNDGFLQPRVVDETGLTGKYTFILEYYSAGLARAAVLVPLGVDSAASSPPAASEPDVGGPNIFTAIQKQLGLRLDKVADVPLEVIVVDSVDKLPTAN
jgi:uncharacterized protein (TIGR03435 family)